MLGERMVVVVLAQAAQVNDALKPGMGCGADHVVGRVPLVRRKVAAGAAHGVDQVEGGATPLGGGRQGVRVVHVRPDRLHSGVVSPGPGHDLVHAATGRAHPVAALQKQRHQPSTHITGGPEHQNGPIIHGHSPLYENHLLPKPISQSRWDHPLSSMHLL